MAEGKTKKKAARRPAIGTICTVTGEIPGVRSGKTMEVIYLPEEDKSQVIVQCQGMNMTIHVDDLMANTERTKG